MKAQPLRVTLREATGSAIIDAAERVAASGGLSGANLQAIADQAGVAVGTIYNYFADKDGLFEALFKRRREEMFVTIDAATKQYRSEPFAAQLDAFLRAVFGFFDLRRDFLRIAIEAERIGVKGEDTKRGPAMQQLQERAERIIRIGVREKQLRDHPPDLLATILVSIVRGVFATRAHLEQAFAPEAERVASIFLQGAGK
jgi:AcrR family transcriptional regulator